MSSPFEELEYVAEHLPEEGETVVIRRECGELVCQSMNRSSLREGIEDAELYGLLVQANERLHAAGSLPLWLSLTSLMWVGISLHFFGVLDWSQWYVLPGLALPLLFGVFHWVRQRQHKLFRQSIRPVLSQELRRRGISPLALIGGVRQHGELRTILDELVEWRAESELPLT